MAKRNLAPPSEERNLYLAERLAGLELVVSGLIERVDVLERRVATLRRLVAGMGIVLTAEGTDG